MTKQRDRIELQIDVTDAAAIGETVHTAVSVTLPEPGELGSPPVVAFGWPGAGYGRGYYWFDMPGSSHGGQAGYHAAEHGWIFVACDHLGVGASSLPDPSKLTLDSVAAANGATVDHVLALLAAGSIAPGFPPIVDPLRIAMGQSMGGCLLTHLQSTAPRFDAVAFLGWSSVHTVVPTPDGSQLTFSDDLADNFDDHRVDTLRWAFHYDDVPDDVIVADMTDYPTRQGNVPAWGSATIPACAILMPEPGVVAEQAAAIDVPVLVASGEIDVLPDPRAEPAAYATSRDITVYVQPRMAHMHNFAGNRTVFWDRIAAWAAGVSGRARPTFTERAS
jgi:pimeloyl-ACP methyl ester carboxylesterase